MELSSSVLQTLVTSIWVGIEKIENCFVLVFYPSFKQTLSYLTFLKAGKRKKVHSFLAAPGKMRVFGGQWRLF